MRYLIRRPDPENLDEIRSQVPDLDAQLGAAGPDFRNDVRVRHNPMQHVTYAFSPKKTENDIKWVCGTIELVGETEKDLRELCATFAVPEANLNHISS